MFQQRCDALGMDVRHAIVALSWRLLHIDLPRLQNHRRVTVKIFTLERKVYRVSGYQNFSSCAAKTIYCWKKMIFEFSGYSVQGTITLQLSWTKAKLPMSNFFGILGTKNYSNWFILWNPLYSCEVLGRCNWRTIGLRHPAFLVICALIRNYNFIIAKYTERYFNGGDAIDFSVSNRVHCVCRKS